MTINLDDNFPKLKDKIMSAILHNPPLSQEFESTAVDAEDVGASFEPRIKVFYDVKDGDSQKKYAQTFVFDKKYNFITLVNENWIGD